MTSRPSNYTNFIEVSSPEERQRSRLCAILTPPIANVMHTTPQFRTYKLVYRRYASLYFTIAVDVDDNGLSYLEVGTKLRTWRRFCVRRVEFAHTSRSCSLQAIHLFVETLDAYFKNVVELDIVFNFHKVSLLLHVSCVRLDSTRCNSLGGVLSQVYSIVDEFIVGGELAETSKPAMLAAIQAIDKLDKP